MRRAVQDGAAAAGVTVTDLITLIVGFVLATEHHPDPADTADRLFRPAVAGLDGPQALGPLRVRRASVVAA